MNTTPAVIVAFEKWRKLSAVADAARAPHLNDPHGSESASVKGQETRAFRAFIAAWNAEGLGDFKAMIKWMNEQTDLAAAKGA